MKHALITTTLALAGILHAQNPAPALAPRTAMMDTDVVIWNTHNATATDRGAKECYVEAFNGDKLLWKSQNFDTAWSPTDDPKTIVTIPGSSANFDRVRVTILKWRGEGGGLSEVQVLRRGQPIARQWKAKVSAAFDGRFAADRITDGVTSSKTFGIGYWLLPNAVQGWVEIEPVGSGSQGLPAPLVPPAGKLDEFSATGKFYVSVDDEADLFLNGVRIHHAGINESNSPDVILKPNDRLVARLKNTAGDRRFLLIFVSTDRRWIISFTNTLFKLLPDPDTADFTSAEFSRIQKYAKQDHVAAKFRPLPFKNTAESVWGDSPRISVLGAWITREMFKPMVAN